MKYARKDPESLQGCARTRCWVVLVGGGEEEAQPRFNFPEHPQRSASTGQDIWGSDGRQRDVSCCPRFFWKGDAA